MKKGNNRNQGKNTGKRRTPSSDQRKDKTYSSEFRRSKPKSEGSFEKKSRFGEKKSSVDFNEKGFGEKRAYSGGFKRDDDQKRKGLGNQMGYNRDRKEDTSRQKDFSSGSDFKNSKLRNQSGFDKKFKSSLDTASFKSKDPGSKSEAEEFKTVYKGRGKDERPIFETIRKSELDKKSGSKKKFDPKPIQDDAGPRPDYNFERLERKQKKNQDTDEIRLNKYISNSGICSRREADTLIQNGDIKVNGEVITEMGYKVQLQDKVTYKNKTINPEKPVYILLNKPKDFITTTDDPMERKTVMQLISNACQERVFPVGRLDRNTTGLLLFTNDGELAAKISHPSNKIKKIYQVTLDKPITKNDEEAIQEGLTLEDGPVKVDDIQVLSKDKTILGLEIHVGKNRIVRRIFAHLGYEVIGLDRVIYAGLDKKDLPRGKYRFLTEKEVINLKFF